MRKIVAGLFVSLDGVAESPDRWVFPYFNEQVGRLWTRTRNRRTPCCWDAGPTRSGPHGPIRGLRTTPTRTSSTTPRSSCSRPLSGPWRQNSTLLEGDLRKEVTKLKEGPGRDIGISGSITLVGSLLKQGLLDELSLLLFPVVVGNGKRLFEDPGNQVALQLIESQTFDNGVLWLRYEPVRSAGA